MESWLFLGFVMVRVEQYNSTNATTMTTTTTTMTKHYDSFQDNLSNNAGFLLQQETTEVAAATNVQSSSTVTANNITTLFLQAGCPSCRPTDSVKVLKDQSICFYFRNKPKRRITFN